MLGRLFKQSTLPNLGASSQNKSLHSSHGNPPANSNTYDDSYTREILYASQVLSLKPLLFNPRRFRLLVCQDGGNLRSKQVLFDSAAELVPGSPGAHTGLSLVPVSSLNSENLPLLSAKVAAISLLRNNSSLKLNSATGSSSSQQASSKNILLSRQLHNVNELNDYMFGRGLPTNESCTATKIHMLAHVNLVYGAYLAVLVTKLFLIVDSNSFYAENSGSTVYDPSWHPASALPTREAHYHYTGSSYKSPGTPSELEISPRSSFHSRFSIGIVIPLESPDQTVEEVLSSNWEVISHYLVILQKVVTKKLILALKYSTVANVCPYINNRRIQFPSNILLSDSELMSQLNKLVKLMYFNANVPRLMSSHSLIKYSLDHPYSKFKFFLLNWALEVINWLEFKDGRNFITMHPGGFLHSSNFSHNSSFHNYQHLPSPASRPSETSGLSGTFLASLLAVLAPLKHLLTMNPMSLDPGPLKTSKEVTRVVIMTGNSAVAKKLIFILNGIIPDANLLSRLAHQENGILESLFDGSDDSDSIIKKVDGNGLGSSLKNIAIVKPPAPSSPSLTGNSSSPNTNLSSAKPIPIRKKMSPPSNSPSDDSISISVSSTRGWEVPAKLSTSLSISSVKKSSFTTETTAVAQQIPIHGRSSLSNSSSMAYLSSSLNSSLSSSASNYSLSKLGGSFIDKWKNPFVGNQHYHTYQGIDAYDMTTEMLNKRPSILSFRTPSPGYEIDEPTWESSAQSFTCLSPGKLKISRTQSMLDLYNYTLNQFNRPQATEMPSMNLKRTVSSVYVPLQLEKGQDISSANSERIKRKCAIIMESRVSYGMKSDLTLLVNIVEVQQPSSASTYFEQSTITSHKSTNSSIIDISGPLNKKTILPPNVAFVDEFRPEFVVQSCPVNPKLEVHVMNAMKNDLLFFQNNCGYEKVTSRTVFISLRAREIKMIEMKVGGHDKMPPSPNPNKILAPTPSFAGSQVTSPMSSNSPISSYFHGAEANHVHQERRGSAATTNYSTVIKKIFTPKSICGDKNVIKSVGSHLEKLTEVVAKINNDGAETTAEEKDHFNRVLFSTVLQLIR